MRLSSAVKAAAVACLILALSEMPDEFYKFLRFVVLGAAIFTILDIQKASLSQNWRTFLTLAFSTLAIIFNPILPLDMEREEWWLFDLLGVLMFGGIIGYDKRVEIGAWWRRVHPYLVAKDVQEGQKEKPAFHLLG